jgi:hypothetical protein
VFPDLNLSGESPPEHKAAFWPASPDFVPEFVVGAVEALHAGFGLMTARIEWSGSGNVPLRCGKFPESAADPFAGTGPANASARFQFDRIEARF